MKVCELCGHKPATRKLTMEDHPEFKRDVCEECGKRTVAIHKSRPPAGVF